MPTPRKPAKRGPRTGEDTYGAILRSALEEFARNGYTSASLRSIARGAGVDPALVHHYFEGKEQLFHRIVSDVDVDAKGLVERLLLLPRELVGAAIVHQFLASSDTPDGKLRFLMLYRATSSGEGLEVCRNHLIGDLLGGLTAALEVDHPTLRAGLVAAELIGLAVGRHVLELAPLTAPLESLIGIYGPTVQHHLFEPLPEALVAVAARSAEESAG